MAAAALAGPAAIEALVAAGLSLEAAGAAWRHLREWLQSDEGGVALGAADAAAQRVYGAVLPFGEEEAPSRPRLPRGRRACAARPEVAGPRASRSSKAGGGAGRARHAREALRLLEVWRVHEVQMHGWAESLRKLLKAMDLECRRPWSARPAPRLRGASAASGLPRSLRPPMREALGAREAAPGRGSTRPEAERPAATAAEPEGEDVWECDWVTLQRSPSAAAKRGCETPVLQQLPLDAVREPSDAAGALQQDKLRVEERKPQRFEMSSPELRSARREAEEWCCEARCAVPDVEPRLACTVPLPTLVRAAGPQREGAARDVAPQGLTCGHGQRTPRGTGSRVPVLDVALLQREAQRAEIELTKACKVPVPSSPEDEDEERRQGSDAASRRQPRHSAAEPLREVTLELLLACAVPVPESQASEVVEQEESGSEGTASCDVALPESCVQQMAASLSMRRHAEGDWEAGGRGGPCRAAVSASPQPACAVGASEAAAMSMAEVAALCQLAVHAAGA